MSAADKRTDPAAVFRRHVQKLDAESGTSIPHVSNGYGAGDQIADAGQPETKTQHAANWKALGSLDKGASRTQVPERPAGFREDAVLAKPDFGVKRNSRRCPLFVYVGLTGVIGTPSPKTLPLCPAMGCVPLSSHEAGAARGGGPVSVVAKGTSLVSRRVPHSV